MAKLAWAGFFVIAAAVFVISSPYFGDRAERMSVAALLLSIYSMVVGFSQAYYSRKQAESAERQATVAEATNRREELADRNSADPAFKWHIPTGSQDQINIHVENVGGLIVVTHAEVACAGVDLPLVIPGRKIGSGETFGFSFKPPAADKVHPFKLTVQFQDAFEGWHQTAVAADGWGKPLTVLYLR